MGIADSVVGFANTEEWPDQIRELYDTWSYRALRTASEGGPYKPYREP